MTLVVGVNLGCYALFAGDSRETVYDPHTHEVQTHDTMEKIRRWPRGLITGSGISRAVYGVIDELNGDPSRHDGLDAAGIAKYIGDFMPAFARSASQHVTNHSVLDQLAHAGWITSSIEHGEMRVRLFHTSFRYEFIDAPIRMPVTLLPLDLNAETSTSLEERLKAELSVCDDLSTIASSIETNLLPLAQFFEEMTLRSQHLGPGLQVGAHALDGRIEIRPIRPRQEYLRDARGT